MFFDIFKERYETMFLFFLHINNIYMKIQYNRNGSIEKITGSTDLVIIIFCCLLSPVDLICGRRPMHHHLCDEILRTSVLS